MTRIVVVGGTGYAGKHIVSEAVSRGIDVVSVSRTLPEERVAGVSYVEGDLLNAQGIAAAAADADAVVFTTAPRGAMAGKTREAIKNAIAALPEQTRVVVVGGAGGTLVAEGGPRVVDTEGFHEDYKPEALEMIAVLDDLRELGDAHDWTMIHPAGGFGAWNEGTRTGSYRDGGDVLVVDAEGQSNISGADFAVALIDEIETPKHKAGRFTVGY